MLELLFYLINATISEPIDLVYFGRGLAEIIEYEVSPDFFTLAYSFITGKGDCMNYAKITGLMLWFKGIDYDEVSYMVNETVGHFYLNVHFDSCLLHYDVANNDYYC